MIAKPTHSVFSQLDPKWCLEQARSMMSHHCPSEKSNASGKFFRRYICWHFHKTSSWPLVQEFNKQIAMAETSFSAKYGKPLRHDFVIVTQVTELGLPICNFHRDGYFFDGQFHLTVKGEAGLQIEKDGELTDLHVPNGTFWYLNGTEYRHRVLPCSEERIEVCAPVNQILDDVTEKMKALGGVCMVAFESGKKIHG